MPPNARITRKWEIFPGRNKFYCDGHLMSAPSIGVFYLTVFLITGTSILFFAFDCPYLTMKISPAIPVVGAVFFLFTMSSLLRTTFSDPGIIPRASQDEAAYIEKQIEVPNSLNNPTYRPPPRTKEILVKGQTIKLKYCFTCKIFRPPRASHCSVCDNCVERFDHHCPWVGNCVGRRNYRFFYMFIVSLAFLAVFIFVCSVTHLVLLAKDQEFAEVMRKAPFSVIVAIICFFSIWSVIGLAGFHTYLTTSDQTTNEDIKGSFSSKGGQTAANPYSKGNVCLNCFYILCGPLQPSMIDRRGEVTDEFRSQMQAPMPPATITASPSVIVTQPIQPGAGDSPIHGKVYDIDIDPIRSRTPEIERRKPLHGHNAEISNSASYLVENEVPLSNVLSPVGSLVTPDVLARRQETSGSYTNLYEEEKPDECKNTFPDTQSNGISQNTLKSSNTYCNVRPDGTQIIEDQVGSVSEKDYSDKSDRTSHMYSNVGTSTDHAVTIISDSSVLDNDDLDLDDPMTATKTFNVSEKNSASNGSSGAGIFPTVTVVESKFANSRRSKNKSKKPHDSSSSSYLSSNGLQRFRDTTMIDTALDLDSLDGSSIGNNSQSCLMKTAKV